MCIKRCKWCDHLIEEEHEIDGGEGYNPSIEYTLLCWKDHKEVKSIFQECRIN